MKICFIGLDGSGKSTQSSLLLNRLKEKNLDVVYRHQFRYESDKIMSLKDKLRPFIKSTQYLFCINDSILIRNPLLKFIRDFFLWRIIRTPFKYIIGLYIAYSGLKKSIEKNNKYGTHDFFIMDRCFVDEVARIEWKLNILLPFRNYFLNKAPTPDITFYFDIPGDISWQRMDPQDTSMVPMILKQAKYRELLPVYSKLTNLEILSVYGLSISEVESLVMNILIEKYEIKID